MSRLGGETCCSTDFAVATKGSSVAQAPSADSSPIERMEHTSRPHLETIDNLPTSRKPFREPRNSHFVLGSDERSMIEQTDAAAAGPVPSAGHIPEHRRTPWHATDGGVRLVGGRAGEAVLDDFDDDGVSEGSTLPPPYSSHF